MTQATLTAVQPDAETAQEIQNWMIAYLLNQNGIDRSAIDLDKEFIDYGLDSAAALRMVGDLEDYLKRKLSPSLPYEHPTIAQLSRVLAAGR